MFMVLPTDSYPQVNVHIYTLFMGSSVHFLVPALHDDFSRCLSLGHQQPWDWEGVPGAGFLSFPGRSKTRGGGAILLEPPTRCGNGLLLKFRRGYSEDQVKRKVYKGGSGTEPI